MTRVTDDLRETPPGQTIIAIATLVRAQRTAEDTAEVRLADRRLLWLLSDGQPRTMRQIADELGLEQSTVNRQVNVALGEGLLARSEADGQHARPLVVTDAGRALFNRSFELHLQYVDRALQTLPADRRSSFASELVAFAEAYAAAVLDA